MSPVAGPLASGDSTSYAPNDGGSPGLTPTKDLRSPKRLSPRQLALISHQLTERDWEVLRTVSRLRVMSGAQLQRLFWAEGSPQTSARLARRGLARLAHLDVLEPLARRVGGERGGSASTTFAVGRVGQYLLGAGESSKRVRRPHTPGARHLAHTLAVAQLYVDLVESQRWGLTELASFEPEPGCWRPYLAALGARLVLKPDAYLRLACGDYEFSWFIEADMATEAQTTIAGKARRYHDYYRSGTEQAERGVFPRVLWIVPDPAHAERIGDTLRELPPEAQRLFAITTAAEASAFLAGEVQP
jgi:hypothetical protein